MTSPAIIRITTTYGAVVVKNETLLKITFQPHKPAPLWFRAWKAAWPAVVMIALYAIWLTSTAYTIASVVKLVGGVE